MNIYIEKAKLMNTEARGNFVTIADERFYRIENADQIPAFFISVVSNSDHWLFASSTGGITAGRVSPETALFPYVTVDKIHESSLHTGPKTLVRIENDYGYQHWEPFNLEHDGRYRLTRNLYKNILSNKLCFEEVNHDLGLSFRYTWMTSEKYGFVRQCQVQNLSDKLQTIELIDGLQNILPAGTPRFTQTNSSNLVDAYKWSELEQNTGLAFFTLYSGITDRAEPCESLLANTVFSLGLDNKQILLSSEQLTAFKRGQMIQQENHKRGIRGAYLLHSFVSLDAKETKAWNIVANVEQTQQQCVALSEQLSNDERLSKDIYQSIAHGSDELERIMAGGDGLQSTAQEQVSVHHYANVLFNILRGGAFDDQYQISGQDFAKTIALFNSTVFKKHQAFLQQLPERQNYQLLQQQVKQQNDAQLERLCGEYLPITFGRRHGDPSRPWNQFAINLVDENNKRLLSYQGNWRDIFQNWEALTFSYPEFIENIIAKFVNASTMDGYNPYRITKQGIDWEVEDEDDPWSYIGYWGDHQIIYLQKMLELSAQFHPEQLGELLRKPVFSYANVPYRIKPFNEIVENAKSTVLYDQESADKIERRVAALGADGKLILNAESEVYQVNLLEKLLVPLLAKLGNFVPDGGIWLNTQRPEWNDANNAIVGQGLSVVTLYYLRRYICFLQKLLADENASFALSIEVSTWLDGTAKALAILKEKIADDSFDAQARFQSVAALGQAASQYRETVYRQESFASKVVQTIPSIQLLLADAMVAIDRTIEINQRPDSLYQAYNLLAIKTDEKQQLSATIAELYPMLEGQVSALSSGALNVEQTLKTLQALFASDVYREDQQSFMLYPDRKLPSFLEKNVIAKSAANAITLVKQLLADKNEQILSYDKNGVLRFNCAISNVGDLTAQLAQLPQRYSDLVSKDQIEVMALYEKVFNHQAFTGRSGGMFGFEGLGCIYWHMVSKLLLAVAENYYLAIENNVSVEQCQQIASYYYQIRDGIGFNKTPKEYGAFPCDPYSHTPKHAGAQQPGMTGQVKEEILTRFAELGIRVKAGQAAFLPNLLREDEFNVESSQFRYLDVDNQWQVIETPSDGLAFTWCQVPIIYQLADTIETTLRIIFRDGREKLVEKAELTMQQSRCIFQRNGEIKQLQLMINPKHLSA